MIRDVRTGPSNGKPAEKLVIFLHGYINNGRDIAAQMTPQLSAELPDARLVFPDAPIGLCEDWENPDESNYRSWFDIQDIVDNVDADIAHARAQAVVDDINAYVDRVMAEENMQSEQVILAGFSQGACMAVHAALARDEARKLGGAFSLSGLALDKITPQNTIPLAIIAGGDEHAEYCGYPHAEKARDYFNARGFNVDHALIPGTDHEISPGAISALAAFTRARAHAHKPQPRANPARQPKTPGM